MGTPEIGHKKPGNIGHPRGARIAHLLGGDGEPNLH